MLAMKSMASMASLVSLPAGEPTNNVAMEDQRAHIEPIARRREVQP
jgi:hypothetical protein